MVIVAGKPSGYLNPEDSVTAKPKWICRCQPNVIFKSVDGICVRCGEQCLSADEFKAQEKASYSPKLKTSKQFDDFGKEIVADKPQKKRMVTLTERDMADMDKKAKK